MAATIGNVFWYVVGLVFGFLMSPAAAGLAANELEARAAKLHPLPVVQNISTKVLHGG